MSKRKGKKMEQDAIQPTTIEGPIATEPVAPPADPPTPPPQDTAQEDGGAHLYKIDFEVFHANGSKDLVVIEVRADDEVQAFARADEKLFAMRTDDDPITWRYTQRFIKITVA
jgi:hypothetical protein